jgi:hypothetical protein
MRRVDRCMTELLNADLDVAPTRTVIPAKAGIQYKHGVRSTRYKKVRSAAHSVFQLDSGFRRNDVRHGSALRQASSLHAHRDNVGGTHG